MFFLPAFALMLGAANAINTRIYNQLAVSSGSLHFPENEFEPVFVTRLGN